MKKWTVRLEGNLSVYWEEETEGDRSDESPVLPDSTDHNRPLKLILRTALPEAKAEAYELLIQAGEKTHKIRLSRKEYRLLDALMLKMQEDAKAEPQPGDRGWMGKAKLCATTDGDKDRWDPEKFNTKGVHNLRKKLVKALGPDGWNLLEHCRAEGQTFWRLSVPAESIAMDDASIQDRSEKGRG